MTNESFLKNSEKEKAFFQQEPVANRHPDLIWKPCLAKQGYTPN